MLNDIKLIGIISNSPRIGRTKAGDSVITCNIANHRPYSNKTDFIQCVFYKQPHLEQVLNKGMKVLIEGRLQQNSFIESNGDTTYYHEVVGKIIQILTTIK